MDPLSIKKAIDLGRAAVAVVREIDQPAWLAARLQASVEEVNRDMVQVTFAVCRALIANLLGEDPSSEEVSAFIEGAIGSPGFPHRAHLLIGALRKSGSWRRRAFLASALYGLQFSALPDDERDRVDMAIERMMPSDGELLARIAEARKRLTVIPTVRYSGHGPSKVYALINGSELRLAASVDVDDGGLKDEVLSDDVFRAERVALAALESLGCVYLVDSRRVARRPRSSWNWQEHEILITAVGELVIRALEEMRPGLEARQE